MSDPIPTPPEEPRRQLPRPAWCINCYQPFERGVVSCYYGSGYASETAVGPLCETCDRLVKIHTGFQVAAPLSGPDECPAQPGEPHLFRCGFCLEDLPAGPPDRVQELLTHLKALAISWREDARLNGEIADESYREHGDIPRGGRFDGRANVYRICADELEAVLSTQEHKR